MKKYYIEPRKIIYRKTGEKSEAERLREHLLEAVLRRNRIHETDARKKRDVKELFQQYGAKAIEEGKNLFALMNRAVERSIDTLNAGKKTQEKRYLSVALIHKLLKEEWSVPGQNVPLFQTNGDLKRQYKLRWAGKGFVRNHAGNRITDRLSAVCGWSSHSTKINIK